MKAETVFGQATDGLAQNSIRSALEQPWQRQVEVNETHIDHPADSLARWLDLQVEDQWTR